MGKAIFITGTGTDVGKTYITALIVKKLRESGRRAGYYKAALSGAEPGTDGRLIPGDAFYVRKESGIVEPTEDLVTYVYREAVSPHLAARWNRQPVDLEQVRHDFLHACQNYDFLTMEGSGGIVCPLRWDKEQHLLLEDLVKALGLSSIIVANSGLGTINSTVLTVEYMKKRGLPLKGIIFNHWIDGDSMQEDNRFMTEYLTGLPVLACVRDDDRNLPINADKLALLYENVEGKGN
jgi:dethiobiotin synthetase